MKRKSFNGSHRWILDTVYKRSTQIGNLSCDTLAARLNMAKQVESIGQKRSRLARTSIQAYLIPVTLRGLGNRTDSQVGQMIGARQCKLLPRNKPFVCVCEVEVKQRLGLEIRTTLIRRAM